MREVRIREVFKTTYRRNPISGHEWPEHGPTTSYEIVGPFGVVDTARSEKKAEQLRAQWQDYYNRLYRKAEKENHHEQ
jgi:hypothetical protein